MYNPTALRVSTHIMISMVVATVATFLPLFLLIRTGYVEQVDLVELAAVFLSYATVYLCVVQVRWNYLFNFLSTIMLVYVFWNTGLYGSALANLYLPIALIYGWYRWGSDRQTRPVTRTEPLHYLFYIGLGLAGWAATYLVANSLGINVPVMDSAILVLTVIAQFMMDNKKLESWLVWILLNIIAIVLYFQSGLMLAGVQYVLFLFNAIVALAAWYRSMGTIRVPYYMDEIWGETDPRVATMTTRLGALR